jgi:beta-lactamase regulating signal transducer with metallopeptidase domain
MTLEILANTAIRMLLLGAVVWFLLRVFRVRNAHVEALILRLSLLAGFALPVLLSLRVAPSFASPLQPLQIVAAIPGATITGVPDSSASAATVLASIYLAVVSLLLIRLFVALAVMWRITRAARPLSTPGDVRISDRVRSPATFGSVVLLPPDAPTWPAEKLDAVLAHERAHVRAGDGYWSWLAQLHAALFWFTPVAWWIQRRLETLAETTSDDAVVIARHDPADYAALLLEFARHPNRRSVAMSVAESNVPERIERLLARTPPATPLSRASRWAAVVLAIPFVVFAASTTSAATVAEVSAAAAAPADPPASAVRLMQPANPDDYYPAVAKAQSVTGLAVVEVDVDVLGQLVDARIVKVEPADPQFGFADAALQVARNTRYENMSQKVGTTKFMVKFALDGPAATSTPAPASSPAPMPASAARAVRLTKVANPDDFYPLKAKHEKVPGEAVVEVAVDPSGKVVNVAATNVVPADPLYGFGPAAERVARATGYANSSQEVSTIKFKVKFTPKR